MKEKITDWLQQLHDIKIGAWIAIIAKGIALSLIPIGLFLFIHNHQWNNLMEEVVKNRLQFWGIIFSILASLAAGRALTNHANTMVAIYLKNEEDFRKEYFRRIHWSFHGIMIIISSKILWVTMHMIYDDVWDGIVTVFGIFIAMYVLRELTVGFDRPEKSKVLRDNIPPDWLEKVKEIEDTRDEELKMMRSKKTPE